MKLINSNRFREKMIKGNTLYFDYIMQGTTVWYAIEATLDKDEWTFDISRDDAFIDSEKVKQDIKKELTLELRALEEGLLGDYHIEEAAKAVKLLSDFNQIKASTVKTFHESVMYVDRFMNDVYNFTKIEIYIMIDLARTRKLNILFLINKDAVADSEMNKNIKEIRKILNECANIDFDKTINENIKQRRVPDAGGLNIKKPIKGVWLSYKYIMTHSNDEKIKRELKREADLRFYNKVNSFAMDDSNGIKGELVHNEKDASAVYKLGVSLGYSNGQAFTHIIYGLNIYGSQFDKSKFNSKFIGSFEEKTKHDVFTLETKDRWKEESLEDCEVYIISQYVSFKAIDTNSSHGMMMKLKQS